MLTLRSLKASVGSAEPGPARGAGRLGLGGNCGVVWKDPGAASQLDRPGGGPPCCLLRIVQLQTGRREPPA